MSLLKTKGNIYNTMIRPDTLNEGVSSQRGFVLGGFVLGGFVLEGVCPSPNINNVVTFAITSESDLHG